MLEITFPFMRIARMRGLPYALVLRVSDHIEGKAKASDRDLDAVGISDWNWIKYTNDAERRRRKMVK